MFRLAMITWLAGCGSGTPAPEADAGAFDAGDVEPDAAPAFVPDPPEAPAAPALPVLEPCPAGWRAVPDAEDAAIVSCDPWPEIGPEDCGPAEAHWPGGAGCERIGPTCPEGDWADDLPVGADVVYVLAGAAQGGEGSEARPFGTIAEAVAGALAGTVVALSQGTFAEAVSVPAGVAVWGACVGGTVLTPGAGQQDEAALTFAAPGGAARRLTILGGRTGVVVRSGGVELEAIEIAEVTNVGVDVDAAATLHVSDLSVRDNEPELVLGSAPAGLVVVGDAQVELDRASFVRSWGAAIAVQEATLVARDLAVRDGLGGGAGLAVWAHGSVSLERAAIHRAREGAVVAQQPGAEIVAIDLSIRDTQEAADGYRGVGVIVNRGATVELTRASIVGNIGSGIAAIDPLTSVAATDVLITDTHPWEEGSTGTGIGLGREVYVWLERVALLRSHAAGLFVHDAEVRGTDVTVRDTRRSVLASAAEAGGDGMSIGERARVELLRAESVRSERSGIFVWGLGAELDATDLAIREGAADYETTDGGEGLVVQSGARATLTRALVEGNRTAGLDVRRFPSELAGTDVLVRDTLSHPSTGEFGVGLWVLDGARVALTRAALEGTRQYGVLATAGSLALLEDLRVQGVGAQECAATTSCAPGGIAISTTGGAVVEARRFLQRDAALCGVQVAGGTLDLHQGDVRDNPIGANVQTIDYDIDRLQDHVRYLDNDRNLDSMELPVPDLSGIPILAEPEDRP